MSITQTIVLLLAVLLFAVEARYTRSYYSGSSSSSKSSNSLPSIYTAARASQHTYGDKGSYAPVGYQHSKTVEVGSSKANIYTNPNSKEVIVAIRGTEVRPEKHGGGIKGVVKSIADAASNIVHRDVVYGVKARAINNQIKQEIKDLTKQGYTVTYTGHSQGGGIAHHAANQIKKEVPQMKAQVITFNSPKTKVKENPEIKTINVAEKKDVVSRLTGQKADVSIDRSCNGILGCHSIDNLISKLSGGSSGGGGGANPAHGPFMTPDEEEEEVVLSWVESL